MNPPIVVGMDLSSASVTALEEAIPIARRRATDIVIVRAIDRGDDSAGASLTEIRQSHLGSGVHIGQAVIVAPAEAALTTAASTLSAELIVVGSRSRGRLHNWLTGSVAQHMVRHSPTDVLVARNQKPGRYRRILVPTDFSPAADRALDVAVTLAGEGSSITLLHCTDVATQVAAYSLAEYDVEQSATEAASRRLEARARRVPGAVTTVVCHRDPVGEIHRLADEHDLIAMGSHGRTGLSRFFLGSIAETAIHDSPCSVYVTHERARA